MKQNTTSETFCQSILNSDLPNAKLIANIMMALATCQASSVVGLSESPYFHFEHSSVFKGIQQLGAAHTPDQLAKTIQELSVTFNTFGKQIETNLDITSLPKPHSPTLDERTMVYRANETVKGNKPIIAGYSIATLSLHDQAFDIPLAFHRIKRLETENEEIAFESKIGIAVQQLVAFAATQPNALIINAADSGFATPQYWATTFKQDNLVSVVRVGNGRRIWQSSSESRKYYGQCYYLIEQDRLHRVYDRHQSGYKEQYEISLLNQTPLEETEVLWRTAKGRRMRTALKRYKDYRFRSKNGYQMKDQQVDVVCAITYDAETGVCIWDRPLWLVLNGKRRSEIGTIQAFLRYQSRFGIEGLYRFCKQRMLFSHYQSHDVKYLDNWLHLVQLSCWLLYYSRADVTLVCSPWQVKKEEARLGKTLSNVCKGLPKLLSYFDQTPYRPESRKGGKGWEKGRARTAKPMCKVYIKPKKQSKKMAIPLVI